MKLKPLVILAGATAVGKTDLSIQLAKTINGEIISADSMQVYRGFDIGTAKVKKDEMQGIPHYLIDELDPEEEFNVFEFKKRADQAIREILRKGKIPIIVGGTGFYIQSVLYDIEFSEENPDKSYRHNLENLANEYGPEYLHEMLHKIDPAAANEIHFNNVKRVIRALEFYHETGGQISEHNAQQQKKEAAYNFAYFVLNRERAIIYERIEKRIDQMLDEGLVNEVERLLKQGISKNSLAMQGLGYKEIVQYLDHKISYEEAVDLLKKSTRHFAKRQITWFKREKETIWMNYEDYSNTDEMMKNIIHILKEKKIV